MPVITERFNIKTRGFNDIIDITREVKEIVARHNVEGAQDLDILRMTVHL